MNTTQMKFQKIVIKSVFFLAAISVFYSLIFASQLYGFIDVSDSSGDIGYYMFEKIQPFNKMLFTLTVAYLLVSISLLVFFSQSRRNYYITNYVAIGVTAVFGVALSVYALIEIFAFMAEFMTIDFIAVNEYLSSNNIPTMTSVPWSFVLGIVVFVLNVVANLASVCNAVWKTKEMKKDKEENADVDAQIYEMWRQKEQALSGEATNDEN